MPPVAGFERPDLARTARAARATCPAPSRDPQPATVRVARRSCSLRRASRRSARTASTGLPNGGQPTATRSARRPARCGNASEKSAAAAAPRGRPRNGGPRRWQARRARGRMRSPVEARRSRAGAARPQQPPDAIERPGDTICRRRKRVSCSEKPARCASGARRAAAGRRLRGVDFGQAGQDGKRQVVFLVRGAPANDVLRGRHIRPRRRAVQTGESRVDQPGVAGQQIAKPRPGVVPRNLRQDPVRAPGSRAR